MPTEKHSRNTDGLIPWKPGQSGNPKGRPKRVSFEALVNQILDERIPGEDKAIKREVLARIFVDELLKRNTGLVKEYLSREWPAVQHHDVILSDTDDESLLDRLAGVARAKRGNGADPEPLDPREETPQ